MNHCLDIRLRNAQGALLRILGVTERRGFKLLTLHLDHAAENLHRLHLRICAEQRSVQVLARQLNRLHDVFEVRVDSPAVRLADDGA